MVIYKIGRKELRNYKASQFKEGDIINTEAHTIYIHYGEYDTPSLCSYIRSIRTGKTIDPVFWSVWFDNFLHDWKYV